MDVSVPHEQPASAERGPKARTRKLMLETAIALMQRGQTPSVSAVAEAAVAAISLLPHLWAFAMMNSIAGQSNGDDFLSLAGPGFRDFTRIAAGDPKMWRDILLSNREELLAQSRLFQQALHTFEQAMDKGDAQRLEDMLTLASETRAHWRMGAQRTSRNR